MARKAIHLPKEFKKYFWDVEFRKISFKKHLDFVLSRLMSFGNMKAVRWMLRNISQNKIKEYIMSSGDRQLDRRSNNFWRVFFGLPASKKEKSAIWPY